MMLDSDNKLIFPIIKDDEFERDKVPMTKSSVRHLSIIRLGLTNDSVLYDIGSGTGSIAIEAAGLSHNIKVIAIEKKEEAISLIEKNKVKFNRDNLRIVLFLPINKYRIETIYPNPQIRSIRSIISSPSTGLKHIIIGHKKNSIIFLYPSLRSAPAISL